MNPRIALEAEFNVLPSSEFNGAVELSSNVYSVTGNVLYHFSERPFVPYALLGIGVGHGSVDVNSTIPLSGIVLDTSSTNLIVNFGGGVERRIRDRMGFRGDLRYFFGGRSCA